MSASTEETTVVAVVPAEAPAPSRSKSPKKGAPKKAAPKQAAAKKATTAKAPPKQAAADMKSYRRAAELLKQVSDPTRLQVLLILSDGPQNVTELCGLLGLQSQPAVSHHLSLCRHGGLIMPERRGKNNYYDLTDSGRELAKIVKSIMK